MWYARKRNSKHPAILPKAEHCTSAPLIYLHLLCNSFIILPAQTYCENASALAFPVYRYFIALQVDSTYNEKFILHQIASGDERAFYELYQRYSARCYSMALSYLRSAFTAQDAVQEIFSKVWQQREALPGIDNFEAWLTTITKNVLINQLKKMIPVSFIQDDDQLPDITATQSTNSYIDYRELEKFLQRAIDQLPQRQREVYWLSRTEGLSHKEIAAKLNISYNTTREHMSQALKNIRDYLEKNYGALGLLIALIWDI